MAAYCQLQLCTAYCVARRRLRSPTCKSKTPSLLQNRQLAEEAELQHCRLQRPECRVQEPRVSSRLCPLACRLDHSAGCSIRPWSMVQSSDFRVQTFRRSWLLASRPTGPPSKAKTQISNCQAKTNGLPSATQATAGQPGRGLRENMVEFAKYDGGDSHQCHSQ